MNHGDDGVSHSRVLVEILNMNRKLSKAEQEEGSAVTVKEMER